MRVITKQTLIATAAERFRQAHQRRGEWLPTTEGNQAAAIYTQLAALATEPSEEVITAAIGDNRWTANLCDECGEDRAVTILFAEEDHHATDAVAICTECLKQAKRIAEASA